MSYIQFLGAAGTVNGSKHLINTSGDPAGKSGTQVLVDCGLFQGPKEWREEFLFWKKAGVTHVTVASTHGVGIHVRIPGRTMKDHIDAIMQYRQAVADLL